MLKKNGEVCGSITYISISDVSCCGCVLTALLPQIGYSVLQEFSLMKLRAAYFSILKRGWERCCFFLLLLK